MTDTQAQEAASLAEWLEGVSEAISARRAAALLRSQAARIAELESRVHTCGPTCSKAGCINRRLTAERDALRAELARMREPLYEALVRLLGSDPDGAIANASEDELTGAANDANAHPVVREQAASVLQARAAAREYEAAHGITKTGEQK